MDAHTLREGLLPASALVLTAGCSTISEEEPGEGKESIATFWSMCITSWFSWELRGSTASLLGTGVRVVGRLAKESEFDLVVSLRQDDGFGVGLEEGVEGLGLDCADALEKKPKMLCCFPVDDSIALPFLAVDGVLAGVCLWVSGLSTIAASATAQW